MKKIFFGIIATVFMCLNATAQENKIVSGKISVGGELIDLPKEVKSELEYKQNSSEFIKYERYSEEFKGIVVTDSKNNIVSITLPPETPTEKMNNQYK